MAGQHRCPASLCAVMLPILRRPDSTTKKCCGRSFVSWASSGEAVGTSNRKNRFQLFPVAVSRCTYPEGRASINLPEDGSCRSVSRPKPGHSLLPRSSAVKTSWPVSRFPFVLRVNRQSGFGSKATCYSITPNCSRSHPGVDSPADMPSTAFARAFPKSSGTLREVCL